MNRQDEIEKALKAVQQRSTQAESPFVVDIKDPFLDGRLYTISFLLPDNDNPLEKKPYINRVYINGSNAEVFGNDEVLLTRIGSDKRQSLIQMFLQAEGISGVIAIMITGAIVLIVYSNPSNPSVPDILANALSVILGFYFGKAASK